MIKKRFKIGIILFIIFAIGGAGASYYVKGKNVKPEYTTVKAGYSDFLQTVSETGAVKAVSEIDLNFLNSGNIGKISVKTGDAVKQGQILTELDYSGLSIKQQEALASLQIAQANYRKTKSGATAEEIAVAQASVNQSKDSYDSSVNELEKTKITVDENIAQAQKTLDDLESKNAVDVTTYEQALTVAQTNLDNTKRTYQQAVDNKKNSLITTVDSKISSAKTAMDSINSALNDSDAKDTLSVKNPSSLFETKSGYNLSLNLLTTANTSLTAAQNNPSDSAAIKKSTSDAEALLNSVFAALNSCYGALENSVVTSGFTQAELDAHKTSISSQLTIISTGISGLETASQNMDDAVLNYNTNIAAAEKNLAQAQANLDNAIITARNALNSARFSGDQQIAAAQSKVNAARESWQVAEAQLAKIKAPAKSSDVDLALAQINQAQATLNSIGNQIQNSVIKAPIDGVITKVEYEIGEQPSAGKPVISMLAKNNFEIEVDVSEADIAKVKLNNQADITLDAFGEEVKFPGKVYFIEPAETKIQDVIYYKVKINFDDLAQAAAVGQNAGSGAIASYYEKIKPGMTANVVITTASKKNVLLIPSRAVIEKNGSGKIVRILSNGQVVEAPITLGLRGDEGMVEVLSGVKEGDKVVTFVKEIK